MIKKYTIFDAKKANRFKLNLVVEGKEYVQLLNSLLVYMQHSPNVSLSPDKLLLIAEILKQPE